MRRNQGAYTDAVTVTCGRGSQYYMRYDNGAKIIPGNVKETGRKIIVLLDGEGEDDYEVEVTVFPAVVIPLCTKAFKWRTADKEDGIENETITILDADPNTVIDERYNFSNINGEWGSEEETHTWETMGLIYWETAGIVPPPVPTN
tara:strand:- start:1035 stop:1472 length:438 start_codon:yes stop_codon:yes gene_type:complete